MFSESTQQEDVNASTSSSKLVSHSTHMLWIDVRVIEVELISEYLSIVLLSHVMKRKKRVTVMSESRKIIRGHAIRDEWSEADKVRTSQHFISQQRECSRRS